MNSDCNDNLKKEALQRKCYVMLEPVTPKASLNFSVELKKVINERNILTKRTRKCVFDALDEINYKNLADSRRQKKESALFEVLSTEKNYVQQLETIINFFMRPTQKEKLLKAKDFNLLFNNINTIYKVNKTLLEELYKGSCNIADSFNKIAPFFKLYSVYACDFKARLNVIQSSHIMNPKFSKFLEIQETRPEVQCKLSALLITPIQRVLKYKLLLKQLLDLTFPEEDEYNGLLDCLKKVEEATNHINKVVKDHENMQRLLELQRCIYKNEPNVITPGRKLIREGFLMKLHSEGGRNEKIYLALMNDIIMFFKLKRDEVTVNGLKCMCIFPLSNCKIVEMLDKGCFRILCQQEDIVLFHENLCETKQWIKNIRSAVEEHLADRKTLLKENSMRRPVKRTSLKEYNEVGLSPGQPLKKRRSSYEEVPDAKYALTQRPPLRNNTLPVFITLKPKEEKAVEKPRSEIDYSKASEHIFVFGSNSNHDSSFTFKMNKFFGGLRDSVKNFFGFKN